MEITKIFESTNNISKLYIINESEELKKHITNTDAFEILKKFLEKNSFCTIDKYDKIEFFLLPTANTDINIQNEKLRQKAAEIINLLKSKNIKELQVINSTNEKTYTLATLEGLCLYTYNFSKYITNKDSLYELEKIEIIDSNISQEELSRTKEIFIALEIVRNIINEPANAINSVELANIAVKLGQESGYSVEVLSKKQIESLRMGGLLAVNKASITPPTFSILQWKPNTAKSDKPIIFIGKGITYDTGGYNIKTGNFMNNMKSDKAGAAVVIGLMYLIAKLELPIYVIGLIPATDNVISPTGAVSGDIITMHNGKTVEIENTDAEGRLILADALSYAQKYNPYLVIDIATLTGTATRTLDIFASAAFFKTDNKIKELLHQSANETYEKIVEFPLWEEYFESLKSTVADIKNVGGPNAGHITAAKFLEFFTNYNWIHLDIAPTAFYEKPYKYYQTGATGIPLRLLFNFLEKIITYGI